MNRRQFASAISWLATLTTGRTFTRSIPGWPAARLDIVGDPIPPRALVRVGTVRFWDGPSLGRLESMAVSPDGRLIATANLHDPVTLWNATTGQVVRRLGRGPTERPGYSYPVHGLAFSADGSTLAVARPGRTIERSELHQDHPIVRPGGKIERWEVATGRSLNPFGGHEERVVGIVYSADGSAMTTADRKGTILIRDPDSGQVRQCLQHPGEDRRSAVLAGVAISADGSKLVSGGDGFALTVWDSLAGRLIRVLTLPDEGEVPEWHRVAITPDGRTVAGLGGAGVEVWDAATGEHRLSLGPEPEWPDGQARHSERRHSFGALALTPDGRTLATAGYDDLVRLWDLDTGRELARLDPISGDPVGVAFGPDDRSLIAVGSQGTIRVWDLPSQTPRVRTIGHQSAVSMLAFAPDGRTLVSVGDDAVCVSRVETGVILRRDATHPVWKRESAFAPGGRWLAYQECGDDRRITVVDTRSDAKVRHFDQFRREDYGSIYFGFAADCEILVVADEEGDDLVFVLIDLVSGLEVRRVVSTGWPHDGDEWSRYGKPSLIPGGRVLMALASLRGYDDSIVLHDSTSGRFLRRIVLPMAEGAKAATTFEAVAYSDDGSVLATIDSGATLRLWEVGSGREVHQFVGQSIDDSTSLAFAPGGKVVATGSGRRGSGGTIQLWDVASGRELTRFDGHEGGIGALAFTANGRRLASGSRDTTVLIWDVAAWTG